MNTNPVIELSEDLLCGKGYHKKCYLHPENKNLCIKISYNSEGIEDIKREINYWKILRKRNKDYSILPKYYQKVLTNKGEGYVFEFIRNFDGSECRTLEDFISDKNLLKDNFDMLLEQLKALKYSIFENEIITLDLFPHNILMQKTDDTGTYRIRMVNDMGSAVLIPLEYYFHYFAKTKVQRRWKRFVIFLEENYPSEYMDKIIAEIK